jgi:hypothetical protein
MVISVTPETARITVDGTPVEIVDGLAPAGRTVTASAPGFRSATVTVQPGEPVELELAPLAARIQVAGAPRRARFSVDGGTRPLEGSELAPGTHVVEVALPGRPVFRRTLTVEAGSAATVHIDPARGGRPKAIVSSLIGVGALGAGAWFGVQALDKRKEFDARAKETGVGFMEERQVALRDDGRRLALYADVSFGVSLVALATSIYWFRTEGRAVNGRVEVKALPGAVQVSGRF